jgi:hypothetical protein
LVEALLKTLHITAKDVVFFRADDWLADRPRKEKLSFAFGLHPHKMWLLAGVVIGMMLGIMGTIFLQHLKICVWLWWISNVWNDSWKLAGNWTPASTDKRCHIPGWLKLRIMNYQKWHCLSCGKPFQDIIEIDHRISLGEGGSNQVTNFQALHPECHRIKTVAFDLQRQRAYVTS